MGIFGNKGDRDQAVPASSDREAINSIVGKEMTIVGDVSFSGKVRVDGTVQGNIKGEYLILSETGRVEGDIQAGSFLCYGEVQGGINAEKLSVQKTARIDGNVNAGELSVDAGASLKGEISARSQEIRLVHGASDQEAQQA